MAEDEFKIIIEGQAYTADDLSFREQREMRTVLRDLMGDPDGDLEDAAMMDFLPALVYVVTRRERPDFTVEEALDLKMSDVLKSANGNGGPPTRVHAKPKAKATT
jgi:hypothetical protein